MKKTIYLPLCFLSTLFFLTTISASAQNAALGKSAVASSTQGSFYPDLAIDGNGTGGQMDGSGNCTSGFCTRWANNTLTDNEWIYIDLATSYDITGVKLYWEVANAMDFKIQTSNDAVVWTDQATITGNSSFINTIPFTATAQYVRMLGLARNSAFTGYSLWEFEITGTAHVPLGSNIALGRPPASYSASSSLFPAVDQTFAFDGQGNAANVNYLGGCAGGPGCTIWASNATDNEWIEVDLGAAYYLRQAALYWDFNNGRDFKIQVSNTVGGPWTDASTVTGNTAYVNTLDLTSVALTPYQFVRMLGSARNTGSGYELFEFEVYGSLLPLPITLADFSATKQNNTAKLSWTTSQEINTKWFVIERSANGAAWQTVTTVPAQGNSNSPIHYTAVDANPAKGVNLYRLKTVDIDNKTSYSATRKVNFDTKYSYSIYPNPATNLVQLTVDNVTGLNVDVRVENAQGQVLIARKINTTVQPAQINVSSLAPGIYMMRITSADGTVNMEKFVKQ